jgi:hypothetical protein
VKLKIERVTDVLGSVPTDPLDAVTTVGVLDSVTVPDDRAVAELRVITPLVIATDQLLDGETIPDEIPIADVSWTRPDDAETTVGFELRVTVPEDRLVALDSVITPEETFTVGAELSVTIPLERDVALDRVTVPLDRLRTVAACATVICPEALTPRMLPLVAKSPMVITCRFVDEVMTIASMNCPLVPTAGGTWTTAI